MVSYDPKNRDSVGAWRAKPRVKRAIEDMARHVPTHRPRVSVLLPKIFVLVGIVCVLAACQPFEALPTQASLPTDSILSSVPLISETVTQPSQLTPSILRTKMSIAATPTASATEAPQVTATSTITETPTMTATPLPLDIDFERVYPIDLPLRGPLIMALDEDRTGMIEHRYTLTAYKTREGWVKMLLVPTVLIEENWQNVETLRDQFVEVVGWQENGQWHMTRIGSPTFDSIRQQIPDSLMAQNRTPPPLAGEYLFPWIKGQTWWAIQGWHDGAALDFQPVTGQRHAVLAAESGWLREICGDGYQSFLEVQHADGRSTFYLHVDLPRRIHALLDHPIVRGQYLGELINESRFATDCGRGLSRHLHFVVSDPAMTINDYTLEDIAQVASCCAAPPMYVSSNVIVDATR